MSSNGNSIKLKVIDNSHFNFYNLIGQFLSKRHIVKELGNNVWDDDHKTWIVAIHKYKVVGFCAFKSKDCKIEFCSDYVIPEYREKGIYKKMFDLRCKLNNQKYCVASTTDKSLNLYLKYGFKIVRQNGRYTVVEKNIS